MGQHYISAYAKSQAREVVPYDAHHSHCGEKKFKSNGGNIHHLLKNSAQTATLSLLTLHLDQMGHMAKPKVIEAEIYTPYQEEGKSHGNRYVWILILFKGKRENL